MVTIDLAKSSMKKKHSFNQEEKISIIEYIFPSLFVK